jgi:hypothetical protein
VSVLETSSGESEKNRMYLHLVTVNRPQSAKRAHEFKGEQDLVDTENESLRSELPRLLKSTVEKKRFPLRLDEERHVRECARVQLDSRMELNKQKTKFA